MASDLQRLAGKPVTHLPHGVDFEYFHERAKSDPIPDDVARLPSPRVGFVGRLNEGLDDSALTEIATRRPDWSVVLVGPETYGSSEERARFLELISRPNVHALGPRPRDAVPAYMAALDVGLLCYRMGNWVMWGQPIKAYEYLACGRPIVSSPIHAVSDFGDLVRVARAPGGWVAAIEDALRSDSAEEAARRESFARNNTWDARVSELVRLIEEHLAAGAGAAR
jgi:glycosyltransferase involved in cell wall biosynthesis